jgi:Ca2+-binding RTX toxin-like protein
MALTFTIRGKDNATGMVSVGDTGSNSLTVKKSVEKFIGGSGATIYKFQNDWDADYIIESTGTLDFSSVERSLTFTIKSDGSVIVKDDDGHKVTATGNLNLIGGKGDNTFKMEEGGYLSGTITGGAGGVNILDYSAYSNVVTVDLAVGSALNTGGVSKINKVICGEGDDTLIGDDQGNILIGGKGDDTLTGNAGSDTYIFSKDSGTDTITEDNSATDTDKIDFSAVDTALTIQFSSDGSIVISDGGLLNSIDISAGNIENIIGGKKDDLFRFNDGITIAGSIDGGE